MYVSFSGIVTFKNAVEIREALRIVPDDQLLIETDAPFLAPVPHRGKKNEPAWVSYVGAFVAAERSADEYRTAQVTMANTKAAFRLT
jgi:TatD DNase family protein